MSQQSTDMIVSFPGGKRVDANFLGFEIKTDQSVKSGGTGTAPEPYALFLASIGTCAGVYVSKFCESRNIPTDNIQIRQKLIPTPEGKIGKIALDIEVPPEFPEKYYDALVRSANGCAVKKTIQNPPEFEVKTVVAE